MTNVFKGIAEFFSNGTEMNNFSILFKIVIAFCTQTRDTCVDKTTVIT